MGIEAPVVGAQIVNGKVDKAAISSRALPVPNEVLPPNYRDNGLTNGEERVMADIERRKLRERIKTF